MLIPVLVLGFQQKTLLLPEKLPKPGGANYLRNPLIVRRPKGFLPKVPRGFHVNLFASGLRSPRWLLVGPNGDVFVTESYQGRIVLLRDRDRTGAAEYQQPFATGLNLPTGMAIEQDGFWVANTDSVVRFSYTPGQNKVAKPIKVVSGIPSRGWRQHWTRNMIFEPGGKHFYLTIGSETNKDAEALPRGAIWRYTRDGKEKQLVADGLRNPVGIAIRPGTKELWATNVERDYMGDNLVPDFFTRIRSGQFYGWPYYYIGKNIDPDFRNKARPQKKVAIPDVLFHAHSTPLQFAFYTGTQFPEQYRGDAFVAMRGSTNRTHKSGYKVVRVHFRNGNPERSYEDFLWGFVPESTKRPVYGRPVGVAQMPDGALLVADEGGHCIWRITYTGR